MKTLETLEFDNSFIRLPAIFYSRHQPKPLRGQFLAHFNESVAEMIGLDPSEARREDFVDIMTAKKPLPGFNPVAACYAGHQFGHLVPRLGDGRAILLGEVVHASAKRWDIQLKGGGVTEYSRDGDGRAVLRSTIREYLCSAAMHGLGVPTTHALFMTGSEEEVYREQIETGAMVMRVAPSHIRFGSFEYYFYSQRYDDLKLLADYVLQQHFPHLLEQAEPVLAMFSEVVESTAKLIAHWQAVGFSHGVMNTDNMSIHGITLDYGPFGFMEQYDPGYICNHSDYQGRYAFDKQPEIGLFNLSCLAQSLLPLLDEQAEAAVEKAKAELERYQPSYIAHYALHMRAKLGLVQAHGDDQRLSDELFALMAKDRVDFTLLFRTLSEVDPNAAVRDLFINREAFDAWYRQYKARLELEMLDDTSRSENMKKVNPAYVLRNYMAEIAIAKARDENDFSELDALMRLLKNPYLEQAGFEHYAGHPPEWAHSIQVSCSS